MTDPDRALTLYNEGRAALELGDFARAIELLERSAALAPHFKTLEILGETLLKSGDPLAAVTPLAAATALNDQVRAPSLLAEAFLRIGELEDARKFAERVVTRDPGNRRALSVLEVISSRDPDPSG